MKSDLFSFALYWLSILLFTAVFFLEGESKIDMLAMATMTIGATNYLKSNEE